MKEFNVYKNENGVIMLVEDPGNNWEFIYLSKQKHVLSEMAPTYNGMVEYLKEGNYSLIGNLKESFEKLGKEITRGD